MHENENNIVELIKAWNSQANSRAFGNINNQLQLLRDQGIGKLTPAFTEYMLATCDDGCAHPGCEFLPWLSIESYLHCSDLKQASQKKLFLTPELQIKSNDWLTTPSSSSSDQTMSIAEQLAIYLFTQYETFYCESDYCENFYDLLRYLQANSYGKRSLQFLEQMESLRHNLAHSDSDEMAFWILIEHYALAQRSDEKSTGLANIENKLRHINTRATRSNGIVSLPSYIVKGHFIRYIYTSNDKPLIELFAKYLQVPNSTIFEENTVPSFIHEHEQEQKNHVYSFLNRNKHRLHQVELAILWLQRKFRHSRKIKEEKNRRMVDKEGQWYSQEAKYLRDEIQQPPSHLEPQDSSQPHPESLEQANTPYTPKCLGNTKLREKILNAVKDINLFDEVSHLCAAASLSSIFDRNLYSRHYLETFNIFFRPAALEVCDVLFGDAKSICLAPNKIDPICSSTPTGTVKLTFDVKKLLASQGNQKEPVVFYKQCDLWFYTNGNQDIKINGREFEFSHTYKSSAHLQNPTLQFFTMKETNHNMYRAPYATMPKNLLISTNTDKMHQVLTLNFFRFLDALDQKEIIREVYNQLDKLSTSKLQSTLTELGKKMTHTTEFNLYGAHQIDFDTLLSIQNIDQNFILKLPEFIMQLDDGKQDSLSQAQDRLPNLFESYHFNNYLLSKVKNPQSRKMLKEYRQRCTLPFWQNPPQQSDGRETSTVKNNLELKKGNIKYNRFQAF